LVFACGFPVPQNWLRLVMIEEIVNQELIQTPFP